MLEMSPIYMFMISLWCTVIEFFAYFIPTRPSSWLAQCNQIPASSSTEHLITDDKPKRSH